MMFRVSAVASSMVALLSTSVAWGKILSPEGSISANSKVGQKLLSKARALNQERDVTWVAQYDIKYTGCSSLVQIRNEEGGGGGGGAEEGMLYSQNLVKFSLCPSGGNCNSCKNGAEYVVNMMDFLDAYTENKMNAQEQACERVREYCYCNGNNNNGNNNGNNENSCLNQCYADAGLDDCIEYEGQAEFEIQRYIECAEMEDGGNNNNYNYNYNNNGGNNNGNYNYGNGQYFIGPYCSAKDGFSIHLGVFYDEGCSAHADNSIFSNRNYGVTLPFSKDPIVKSECISCLQVDDNNNNNNYNYNNNNNNNANYYNYYNAEVNEMCEQVYERAARCESNLDINYKDSSGCEYIHKLLPKLETATRSVTGGGSGSGAATTFAILFACTTVLISAYAVFLWRKLSFIARNSQY